MNIGIDVRLWRETGVGRYIRNLIKNLAVIDKKNSYTLFALSKDMAMIKDEVFNLQTNNWHIVKANIRWHSFDEQIRLPRLIKKQQIDLMHFPYFSVPLLYNDSFIVTIHDLIIHHFPTGEASTLPLPLYMAKRMFYKQVVVHAARKSKKIIVPLASVKNDLLSIFPLSNDHIAVTPEGFDANITAADTHIRETLKINNNYFLYVGNAYPHKNLDRLLAGFSQFLEKTNAACDLLLVGRDDFFYKRLSEKIKKKKNAHIHILHAVTDEQLGDLYHHAVALVAPSLMEGFGLTPLEAMALDCLVVASKIPAFVEVCQENAIYFDPYNISDLTQALEKAFTLDKKEKQQYSSKGKKRVNDFSWEKMAQQTLDIYESSARI